MNNHKLPHGGLPSRHHLAVLSLGQGKLITAPDAADHLGITVHQTNSCFSDLIEMGYLRHVPIDGARFFRTRRAGGEVVETVEKKDDEFWLQAGLQYCPISREELADLQPERDRLRHKGACPVPSCDGPTFEAPGRSDLAWVCLTCGLARPLSSLEWQQKLKR